MIDQTETNARKTSSSARNRVRQTTIFRLLVASTALVAASTLTACGSDSDDDSGGDTGVDVGDTGTGDATMDVDPNACPVVAETCGPVITGPGTYAGTTAGATNDSSGSCGGGSASDTQLVFVAPTAGDWTFSTDTEATTFDTSVYMLDGECGGDELVCGDDITSSNWSTTVSLPLEACQVITIVVDGFQSEPGGAFGLEVTTP